MELTPKLMSELYRIKSSFDGWVSDMAISVMERRRLKYLAKAGLVRAEVAEAGFIHYLLTEQGTAACSDAAHAIIEAARGAVLGQADGPSPIPDEPWRPVKKSQAERVRNGLCALITNHEHTRCFHISVYPLIGSIWDSHRECCCRVPMHMGAYEAMRRADALIDAYVAAMPICGHP